MSIHHLVLKVKEDLIVSKCIYLDQNFRENFLKVLFDGCYSYQIPFIKGQYKPIYAKRNLSTYIFRLSQEIHRD